MLLLIGNMSDEKNTLISCHTRRRPAHQAQFWAQYPPQGYFDLQLRSQTSNIQIADRLALLPKVTAAPNKMEKLDCMCEITDTRAAGCIHKGQSSANSCRMNYTDTDLVCHVSGWSVS